MLSSHITKQSRVWCRGVILFLGLFLILLVFSFRSPLPDTDNYFPDKRTLRECVRQIDLKNLSLSQLSTCNALSAIRGFHQRVIAFSFYVNPKYAKRDYFKGIIENAQIMATLFPGWVMRVYHNIPEDGGALASNLRELLCQFPNIDVCPVSTIPYMEDLSKCHGMFWRFLSLGDPLVDVFLSRDLDSRLSMREKRAIEDWLNTNKTFHVVRDHPRHVEPIMGGIWGAQMSANRSLCNNLLSDILKPACLSLKKGHDQHVLKDQIWPKMAGNVIQHDSYHCDNFGKAGGSRPWPTKRLKEPYNFVGAVIGDPEFKVPLSAKCPLQCRPPNHKEWSTC